MGRPKKPIQYDEEIQKIDLQIVRWKNTITELEEQRRELLAEKERNELESLYQMVSSTGMTVNEIINLIKGSEITQPTESI